MVTLAYRLNAFGFMSFEDPMIPGNVGLNDQYLAILWVYENIDALGGDRTQITLMGHSAGAASVFYHLISQKSQRYINRAIMMSGSVLAPWAFQPEPMANAKILANALGCFSLYPDEMLECLQVSSSSDSTTSSSSPWSAAFKTAFLPLQNKRMQDIVTEVNRLLKNGNVSAIFAPVNDYNYLPSDDVFVGDEPLKAIVRGDFKKVPMITGVVSNEGVLMGYFLKDILNRLSVEDIK